MAVRELPPPVVDPDEDWHAVHAAAFEADVRLMQRWITATEEIAERLEDDERACHALRSALALVKEHRNDCADAARALRARAVEP